MDHNTSLQSVRETLLDAALAHVPFDGWSETTFKAAIADLGTDIQLAQAACSRGALDLAIAFHRRGDEEMRARVDDGDLKTMKIRKQVTALVRARIEAAGEKEIVRRGTATFALPQNAVHGAQLIWGTADAIWKALGDTSEDFNWYSKRAILSGVYTSTILFWLGDESPDHQATWAFLDRRIENVMQFERVKGEARENPTLGKLFSGPNWLLSRIKAPVGQARSDLPGRWSGDI